MWQKEFAIERTINEKICIDRDGNPIPGIPIRQLNICRNLMLTIRMSLSSAADIPPYSGRTEPDWLPALKTIQTGLPNGRKVLTDRIWTFAGETKAKDIIMPYLKTAKNTTSLSSTENAAPIVPAQR